MMRSPRQISGPPLPVRNDVINLTILKDTGFKLWFAAAARFGFALVLPFTYVPSFVHDILAVQSGQHLSLSAANALGRVVIGNLGNRFCAIRIASEAFMSAGVSCIIWMYA